MKGDYGFVRTAYNMKRVVERRVRLKLKDFNASNLGTSIKFLIELISREGIHYPPHLVHETTTMVSTKRLYTTSLL